MRPYLTTLCLSAGLALMAPPASAASAPVTPLAPTVVDECGLGKDTVTIPEIDGIRYLVDLGGQTIELTPGAYAGIAFIPWEEVEDEEGDLAFDDEGGLALPDARATITAEALDGYALADGVPTSFDVTLSSGPCASTTSFVTAMSTECGTITFTNPAGNPDALVMWVDASSLDDYAEVVVPPGTSHTVSTSADEIDWFAVDDSAWDDTPWEDELEDEFEGASTLAATFPDYVTTQEDRDELTEAAEFFDAMLTEGLGGGFETVDQDCATPPVDEPGDTGTPKPSLTPTPGATPEIPAVVQTDGVAPVNPAAPLLLGGLTALIAWSVLRPRRQS